MICIKKVQKILPFFISYQSKQIIVIQSVQMIFNCLLIQGLSFIQFQKIQFFSKLMGNDISLLCCSNTQRPKAHIDLENLIYENIDFNRPQTFNILQKVSKQFIIKQGLNQEYIPLISRLIANNQRHLIQAYKKQNSKKQKEKFMSNLEFIDVELVDSLFHNFINKMENSTRKSNAKLCQYMDYKLFTSHHKQFIFNKGIQAITQNKVGLLLLCGGSSCRFAQNIPKFIIQTNLPSKKSILQLILMRLKKLVSSINIPNWNINIFLMCNEKNYHAIKTFLHKVKYCGIPQSYFHWFLQDMIPILNKKGEVCLNKDMKIIQTPAGSGQFLQSIIDFKLKNKIIQMLGIKYLCVSGLENILQRPCDPILIGQMIVSNAQIAGKCTNNIGKGDPFYRYLKINGKVRSINPLRIDQFMLDQEYFQKSPVFMNSVIFNTEYFNKLLINPQVRLQIAKTFHIQKRSISCLNTKSNIREEGNCQNQNCYIFQKQLTDLFLATDKVILLKVDRQKQFFPIIYYQEGQYSLREAQKVLINLYSEMQYNKYNKQLIFSRQQIVN